MWQLLFRRVAHCGMCDGLMASCHCLGIISFLSRVAAVEIKSEAFKNKLVGLYRSPTGLVVTEIE
jgi:hypothetical protein